LAQTTPVFAPGLRAVRRKLLDAGYPSKRVPTLVAFFGRCVALEEAAVARSLGSEALEEMVAAGMVEVGPDRRISSRVRLDVYDELVVASDGRGSGGSARSRVPGLTAVSRALAALTVRRTGEAALDLGTGSGIHAFLAARHAGGVRATDINPRALAFAEFNARLNDVENVTFSSGDWLEGLDEGAFDLITASPAGTTTLESVKAFRESGLADDSDAYELVRSVPRYLVEGGFAHVFCNRLHQGSNGWHPFEELLEGVPCDALLLVYEPCRPIPFVDRQHAVLARQDTAGRAVLLERWRSFYEDRGITRSAWGVVVLRGTPAPGFRKVVERPDPPEGLAGDEVAALFAA
jgi:SAM-dependent methyltransferase